MKIIYILLFTSVSIFAEGFLKADGKIIVDGNGEDFFLKGMGIGGWVLQEGYMLHTSGFANAEHEIRENIEDLIGAEKTEEYYDKYHKNFVTEKDIDQVAEWGFNSVRLAMHYNKLSPKDEPYVYTEEGFAQIDSLLSWCINNELYLILDLHAAPGGQSDEPISDWNPDEPSLWESDLNKDRTVALWKVIAERYADEEWIGGYDLLNEPKWELGPNNAPLRELYIRITNAIREVDTNHILFMEGNWFATNFAGLTPPWDDNMAYSFHKYWNENTQSSIQGYVSMRENHNVPLWLGETGENSNHWFAECAELMKENNIGWAWWTLKKIESQTGPLSVVKTEQYDRLLKYWNGEAQKPTEAFAYAALMIQAEELKFENCKTHPDVIDAILRQPEREGSIPFMEHKIPGTIFLTDYNYGINGEAYSDNDFQNIGGSQWNLGYRYRNDGVDIEECTDSLTNGFNVGWTDNEWLKFTVNIEEEGTYDIILRYSAGVAGGQLIFTLDGSQNLTQFANIPTTGGWQNWRDLKFENVSLPAGVHDLQLRYLFGGFNLNYLKFIPKTVGVKDEETIPESFGVKQNYPNPFNAGTIIEVDTPKAANVTIKIFNFTGELIKTLAQNDFIESSKKYGWDGTNDYNLQVPSGVYFYRTNISNKSFTHKMVYLK